MSYLALAEEDVARIADAVAERLADRPGRLVTAAELAEELRVSTDYVYSHKDELAMVRVGGALRFDLDQTRRLLSDQTHRWLSAVPEPSPEPTSYRRERKQG